jgi:hypothetical protein
MIFRSRGVPVKSESMKAKHLWAVVDKEGETWADPYESRARAEDAAKWKESDEHCRQWAPFSVVEYAPLHSTLEAFAEWLGSRYVEDWEEFVKARLVNQFLGVFDEK